MIPLRTNPHFQTIFPILLAKISSCKDYGFKRITIDTRDGDFMDLDYFLVDSRSTKIAVLIHGLEGSSKDAYMINTAKTLASKSINSVLVNLRSCSGRLNKHLATYHSGKTEDLKDILDSIDNHFNEIYLVGFSIGGNIVLKYLGEDFRQVDPRIKKAIAICPPVNLKSSAEALSRPNTKIYMNNFLSNLRRKIRRKQKMFPGLINDNNYFQLKNFFDYDNRYTAPLNGFVDAHDYWQQASSDQYLENIKVKTVILSALDDPFLGPECFPEIQNSHIQCVYTPHGGHLGFMAFDNKQLKLRFLYQDLILSFFLD